MQGNTHDAGQSSPRLRVPVPLVTNDRGGFSIVELTVIVILVGLMASIAVPRIDRTEFQIRSAIQQVQTTLIAAKHMAVLKQHDVVLAFDTAQARIRVHSDANSNGAVDSGEDVRVFDLPEDIAFGKGSAPAWGTATAAVNFTQAQAGLPSLTFHRNGAASEETRFYVTTYRAALNGGFPEDARAVDIQRATGRVDCRSYDTTDGWREAC